MSNIPPQSHSSTVEAIYAQLNQHDIEQFSAGYQRWNLQQQIAALETRLDSLRQQIVENTERMQAIHPTAIALAALARLQANGVSDIELLDRMLEQGEMWLDRTMQRLNYCEQLDDFIRDDYTQWCQHALEGAYDWIDSMLDGSHSSFPTVASEEEELAKATEESFLRKLGSDEDEQDEHGAVMLEMETTHKRQAITIAHSEDTVSPVEDIVGEVVPPGSALPTGAINRAPTDGDASSSEGEQTGMQEYIAFEESLASEDSATPEVEELAIHEYVIPESGEEMEASDIVVEVAPPSFEHPGGAINRAPTDEASLRSPEVSVSDNGEAVIQEYVTSEESFSVESSSFFDNEQPDMQALDEVAPVTKDLASALPELPLQSEEFVPSEADLPAGQADVAVSTEADSVEPSQTVVTQPARRHNFLVRLLAKLFGK